MKTYQDYELVRSDASKKNAFILAAIAEHIGSRAYQTAVTAEKYFRQENEEILLFSPKIYNAHGQSMTDFMAPNNKICSNFFNQFVTQENQYLLSNGIFLNEAGAKKKLGIDFDTRVQDAGLSALIGGVSYAYFDNGCIKVFNTTEFVPLYDERTSKLRSGIRFWRVSEEKPRWITLYEEDGITEYKQENSGASLVIYKGKIAYKTKYKHSKAFGAEAIASENYKAIPIVPLFANRQGESELVGIKGEIDLYDRIFSDFGNDFDRATSLYWVFKNCGGMENADFDDFQAKLKTYKAFNIGDEEDAVLHTIEIPHEARAVALELLENRLYQDYGALNVKSLTAGTRTATEIRASYLPVDSKADGFEYQVIQFVQELCALIGYDAIQPKCKRNKIVNELEEVQKIALAAPYLDDRTILRLLPFIGEEEIEDIIRNRGMETDTAMMAEATDPDLSNAVQVKEV